MMIPSVADERAAALSRKYEALEPRLQTKWSSNGPLVSLLFFALTLMGVAALFGLFELLRLPKGPLTAAIAIGFAEWLIWRGHFFGSGVESALWLGGLFALIFGLQGHGNPEALLLFAVASGVAGVRVRNVWFATLAMVFVVFYLDIKNMQATAVVLSLVVAIGAALALSREWHRPSTEMMFSILAIVMPVAGYAAGPVLSPLLWLALFALFFFLAVKLRHHALFMASFVAIALTGMALRRYLPWPREWQLIAAGAVLLVLAAAAVRALRGRERGIVLRPMDDAGMAQLFATVQLSPTVEAAPAPEGGGGSFGGAGASGKF